MPDRTTFVCGNVFMKDVTPEMFQWWFAWMPADPIRGRLWDPEEHLGMTELANTVYDDMEGQTMAELLVEQSGKLPEEDTE